MTEIDAAILRDYASVRADVAPGEPVTLLHIGRRRTTLVSGMGTTEYAAITLALGSSKTAEDFFKHDPPRPGEIENAIAAIEDELARARAIIADGSVLATCDDSLRGLADATGVAAANERVLSLEAVEQLYQNVAATSLGAATVRTDVGPYATYVATVLILRDLMHHLRFPAITVAVADPRARFAHPF